MQGLEPQDPVACLAAMEPGLSGTVLVAVSGGSDSTALLCAAHALSENSNRKFTVVATTVDHGLRQGSASEAAAVGAFCSRLGVRHIVKNWTGLKPSSAIQAEARAKRRVLLCEAAWEAGASTILTGHTLNDQIETVAMRQRRGDGPGLAGMAPASLAFNDSANGAGIWIVRPFLNVSRVALRDWLVAQDIIWTEDPSNENSIFERVLMRREIEAAGPEQKMALQFLQVKEADERVRIAREASRLLTFYLSAPVPGLLRLDPGVFQSAHLPAISTLIRVLIAHAGASSQLPDPAMADFVLDAALRIGFGAGRKPSRRAASGALIDVRKDGVWFLREKRRPTALGLPFDGRYRMVALRREPRNATPLKAALPVAASLAAHAASAEPVYVDANDVSMPAYQAALSGEPLRRLLNPWPDLVPGFEARLAEKLSLMVGEGHFPACSVHPDGKN